MFLEHLTSYLNAYVNYILYGSLEILLNLMFIRNCYAIERKTWFWQSTLSKFLYSVFNVFFFFITLKLCISYILIPLSLYFYGIYSKDKKA